MNLRRVWVQCVKELVEFRRDPLSVALAFALPFAILLIFGFAIRLQITSIPVGIQDFDRSPFSREFVAQIEAGRELVVRREPLDRSPLAILDAGEVRAAIVIPPGSQRALAAGRPAPIQSIVDATDVVNATTIKQVLEATAAVAGAAYQPPGNAPPVALHQRIWFNPGSREALYIVPGVFGVVLAVFPSLLGAMFMVRDKERGTIVQAYASRLRASELIAGKWIAVEAIGIAEACAIVLPACAIWHIGLVGEPWPLLIGTPLLIAAQVMVGLLIGAATSTVTSAIQISGSSNMLVSMMLSGYLYPVFTMPPVFQWISVVVPNRHYVEIARDAFVRGGSGPAIWGDVLALALLAAVLSFAAWLRVRRMQLEG